MGDFSADWLSLREPADQRARSAALAERLAEQLKRHNAAKLPVIDLGSGAGANLRYLAPRLGGAQDWLCLDKDPDLLHALTSRTTAWAASHGIGTLPRPEGLRLVSERRSWEIRVARCDLATDLERLPLAPQGLVSAAALLDLVSESWLRRLLALCAGQACVQLYALNYDGRVELSPSDPLDGLVVDLVNHHQRRNKGFGAALGPGAPQALACIGAELGLQLESATSDWQLGPDERALQHALIDGWARAALEQAMDGPQPSRCRLAISEWRARRLRQVAAGQSRIIVGHADFLLS